MRENSGSSARDKPTVLILMATFNGGRHISEQLASIASQTYSNWALWISDDGSSDTTLAQIEAFSELHQGHEVRLFRGPRKGPAQNFLSLLANPQIPKGPIAFADQDDVWFDEKLARACLEFEKHGQDTAVAYSCSDIATDPDLVPLRRQTRGIKTASFPNALVQNVMRGNSIVLNDQAAEIVRGTAKIAASGDGVAFHDWWTYLVLSGVAAEITIDPIPGLFYRQHDANALGANVNIRAALRRLRSLYSKEHQTWISRNLEALAQISEILTPENRQQIQAFLNIRNKSGFRGLRAFLKSDIRWQSTVGTAVIALQAFRGRL